MVWASEATLNRFKRAHPSQSNPPRVPYRNSGTPAIGSGIRLPDAAMAERAETRYHPEIDVKSHPLRPYTNPTISHCPLPRWVPGLPYVAVFCLRGKPPGLYGFDVRGPASFPWLQQHYWYNILGILRGRVGAEVIVTSVPS